MYEVYIILDPAKKGNFCFGDYGFLYKPLYVGKGTIENFRKFRKKNKAVNRILANRRKVGLEPRYDTLFVTDDEQVAYAKEIELIKTIGRRDRGGILFNFTDGGEGGRGFVYSEKQLKERSERMRLYFSKMTEEQRKEHGARSLKNRDPKNVRIGAAKLSQTKRNMPLKEKQRIEKLRRQKWEETRYNRTPEQEKITSQKCAVAGNRQSRVYFDVFLADQNAIISKKREEWNVFGIPQYTLYRIRDQKRFGEEFTTTAGIKFKLIGWHFEKPSVLLAS
jgi:hypothetical protein